MLVAAPPARRVVEPEELTPYLGAEDSPHEDGLLTSLLLAATDRVESRTGRALIQRVWTEERRLNEWLSTIRLYRGPVVSVASVHVDGVLVESPGYQVDDDAIHFDPVIVVSRKIRVVYTAGYSDVPAGVPDALRVAILRAAATWYGLRETAVIGTITAELPSTVNDVIGQYRRVLI